MRLACALLLMAGLMPSVALAQSRSYQVSPFTAVEIANGLHAEINVGGNYTIIAHAKDAAMLESVNIDVAGGKLTASLGPQRAAASGSQAGEVTITISAPELKSATARTGAIVNVVGMGAEDISLEVSSKAVLEVTGATGTSYHLSAAGEGQLMVAGACETATIQASGSAKLQAQSLLCDTVQITAGGRAHAAVYASGSVKADASGSATIDVMGHPRHVERKQSGGGTVNVVEAAVITGVAFRPRYP
jgi:hypothetical protein